MDGTPPDDDDPRRIELETLEAIYPEIQHQDGVLRRFTFELELPVRPADPVTVLFPAALAPQQGHDGWPLGASTAAAAATNGTALEPVDSLLISHLPPLSLKVTLPDGYPTDRPPQVTISTTPQWLSQETLASLANDGPRLWEEAGRDLIAYTYVDHVQRAAENVFGAITAEGTLEVDPEHKLAVLDYDIKAKKAAFEKETFECGICLDPKKGSKCHKMLDCGHIFCLQCLRDFYNDAIREGNLSTVRCLTPNCAKERAAAAQSAEGRDPSRQARKPRILVSPSELLQIGLAEDVVKRYVTLKYKTELESDKDTIYCPRQWCNGAARSRKHRKPEGLDFADIFDAESDPDNDDEAGPATEEKGTDKKKKAERFNPADLLSVCEECGFAFCSRCLQTWHGEFVRCMPKRDKGELTEEEKASLEYLQLHTSPCPTCNAPAQKTHGCNHMICSRCDTHFCYLCSSWLDPGNPYKHYNQQGDGKVTSCYMRLWELEGGDGDDVGLGFIGGRGPGPNLHGQEGGVAEEVLLEIQDADDSEPEPEEEAVNQQQRDQHGQGEVNVAREAPLVLRLMDNAPRGGRRGGRNEAAQPAGRGARPAARGRGGQNQAPLRGAARGMDARGQGAARGGRVDRGARGGRGQRGRGARGAAVPVPHQQQQAQGAAVDAEADALDPAQEAWVRRFVQMALIDAEDEVEGGDSDSDDGNWRIR